MDFCYVWLRRLLRDTEDVFEQPSTRNPQELTANEDMGRGIQHFARGLSQVFQQMAYALKPGRPMAFTYHHNTLTAYSPIVLAVLDAGLTCSASFPCPAEMGASIHINGTGSSIVDTIFLCRSTGRAPAKWIVDSIDGVARLVIEDLDALRSGSVNPTEGDARCIAHGHLSRLAVWFLRETWDKDCPIREKLKTVDRWFGKFGGWQEVKNCLSDSVVG